MPGMYGTHGWVIMALYNKVILIVSHPLTEYCPPRGGGEVINLGMVRRFGMVGNYD